MTDISKLQSQAQTRFLHYLLGKKDPEEFITLLERYYKLYPQVSGMTSITHAQPIAPSSAAIKPSAKVETPAKDLVDKTSKISKPLTKVTQPKSATSAASVRRTIRRSFHSILSQEPVRGLLIKKDKIAELRTNPLKVLSRTAGYSKLFSSSQLGDVTVKQFRDAMKISTTEPGDKPEQPKKTSSSEPVSKTFHAETSQSQPPIISSERSILADSPIEEEINLTRSPTKEFLHEQTVSVSSLLEPITTSDTQDPKPKIASHKKIKHSTVHSLSVDSPKPEPTSKVVTQTKVDLPKSQGASPIQLATDLDEEELSDAKYAFIMYLKSTSVTFEKSILKTPFGKDISSFSLLHKQSLENSLLFCRQFFPNSPNFYIRIRATPLNQEDALESFDELTKQHKKLPRK